MRLVPITLTVTETLCAVHATRYLTTLQYRTLIAAAGNGSLRSIDYFFQFGLPDSAEHARQGTDKSCLMTIASWYHPFPSRTGP